MAARTPGGRRLADAHGRRTLKSAVRQMPLSVRLRDASRFSTFAPGRNREALERLADPACDGRCVWLWGRPGTGKTHLLQAACAAVGERGETAAYVDLGTDATVEQIFTAEEGK